MDVRTQSVIPNDFVGIVCNPSRVEVFEDLFACFLRFSAVPLWDIYNVFRNLFFHSKSVKVLSNVGLRIA